MKFITKALIGVAFFSGFAHASPDEDAFCNGISKKIVDAAYAKDESFLRNVKNYDVKLQVNDAVLTKYNIEKLVVRAKIIAQDFPYGDHQKMAGEIETKCSMSAARFHDNLGR